MDAGNLNNSFDFLRTSMSSIFEIESHGWSKTVADDGKVIEEPRLLPRLSSLAWSIWDKPVGQLTEKSFRLFDHQLRVKLDSLQKEHIKLMKRTIKEALVDNDDVKLEHAKEEVNSCEESLLIDLASKICTKKLSNLKQKIDRAKTNQERSRLASQIMQTKMGGPERVKQRKKEFGQIQGRLDARIWGALQDAAKPQILNYNSLIKHTSDRTFDSIPVVPLEQLESYVLDENNIKQRLASLLEIQDIVLTMTSNLANDEQWLRFASHNRDFETLQFRLKEVADRIKNEIKSLEVSFITQFAQKRLNPTISCRPDRERPQSLLQKQRLTLDSVSLDLKAISENTASVPSSIKIMEKRVADECAVIDFNESCNEKLLELRDTNVTKEQLRHHIEETEEFLKEEIPQQLLDAEKSNALFLHEKIKETLSSAKQRLAKLWKARFHSIEKALRGSNTLKETQKLMRVCRQEQQKLKSERWDKFYDSAFATGERTLEHLAEAQLPFFLPRIDACKTALKNPPETTEELLNLQKAIETLLQDLQASREDLIHAKKRGFLRGFDFSKTLDDVKKMKTTAHNLKLAHNCREKFTSIQQILSDPKWESQLKDPHYVRKLVKEIEWLQKTLDERTDILKGFSSMAQETKLLLEKAKSLLAPKLKAEEVIMLTTFLATLQTLQPKSLWWNGSFSMPLYTKSASSLPPPKELPAKRVARCQQPRKR